MSNFALAFSTAAVVVSIWSAWFGWHCRQSTIQGSRVYKRKLARMNRRQRGGQR